MGTDNLVFLENLEWLDPTGDTIVQRLPAEGSGEIKWGAQLTVRDSQAAVFFYQGRALEAFGPGRHTLKTLNLPVLTKILSVPWGLSSPLRAEVYFVNLKVFTDLKWGTRDPVAFRDAELGLVRLRAFGVFNVQVVQPILFINSLVGTRGIFTTEAVEGYLNRVIVSRFNDYMGETIDTIFDLPARYDQLSEALARRLKSDLARFGMALTHLYINAITPPPEVQQAIDDRSRLGALPDLERLARMKAAMAMEKAADGAGATGEAMGAGIGLMLPAMFARLLQDGGGTSAGAIPVPEAAVTSCPDCGQTIPAQARFCPFCGHQQVVFRQCAHCGKNLAPNARFCPRCGRPADAVPAPWHCAYCGAENLPDASFCNQCGERHKEK
ncbi:MAG TPA: SPFH domain-containing protein [Desulfobacteraceae bacterium]|nr:SPFH domain-containing protein [Deltaproteobacteria bacterium]MBW2355164.1 SPFH domain-containing protein [Deltaproteobacteria bacterium]HDI59382.1 SPFH domain-containing protein [Desulfobacteraceae bacterium]